MMSSPGSTHFRLTEAELQVSALRAQVLERCRRTLNHDMNNAVQSIHSGLELLAKCINAPGVARVSPQECIALLQQQFTSLQRTLNKLISEIAEPPGATETFELSALVHDAVQALRHERAAQKARVQIDSGIKARARKVNVRTFMLALLLDAIDHLEADGTLELAVMGKNGEAIVEIRSKTSERSSAIAQLVKHLVAAEEGELRIEQQGQMRLVTMQLPAPSDQDLGNRRSDKGQLNVLIADRNRDAADSLAMIVQLEGHQAKAIYTGAQLSESLNSFAPDIVLLDTELPGCDIRVVATMAHELPQQPLLVQISSSDRKRYEGFDAHLIRPVEWPQLLKLLESQKSRR